MDPSIDLSKHNCEIQSNKEAWQLKSVLKKIYDSFYSEIAKYLVGGESSKTVELGSGIGHSRDVIPNCLRTDLFPNPWLDQVENAYQLTFEDNSIDNLILFDVFHHLRYPAVAFREFERVLKDNGRVIVFEPYLSLLGLIVYGLCHSEALGLNKKIETDPPKGWVSDNDSYYAAQGNAYRIFNSKKYSQVFSGFQLVLQKKYSAISYVASGGYSKPQLYPDSAYNLMKKIDWFCDKLPALFATRLLVTLEKK